MLNLTRPFRARRSLNSRLSSIYALGQEPTLPRGSVTTGLRLCVPKTPCAFDRLKESPNVSA
jgi:hypothetical protein